jgi:hypothetical protein
VPPVDDAMHVTLTLGWWILPLMLSIAFYAIAVSKFSRDSGDYSFAAVWNLILVLVATIPTLIVWLVWALVA